MRQFNLEIDKTSPKTSRFVVPANEHFSILVRYKNWEDKQEWLDYTLVDDAGTDIVKYKKEAENDSVLYFCGIMDTSTQLGFKTSTLASTLAPRDTIQVVAIPSSSQDNCYICSADYARTTGGGGGFTEDTTTLSVAFAGFARKITPKDVISFSSLTWQGERHELGSKDFGVFDGNFQLDEAFWPAKPLPGYLYIQIDGVTQNKTTDRFYLEVYDAENHNIGTFDVINNMVYKIPDNANWCQLRNIEIENYGNKNYLFTKYYYNVNTSVFDIYDVSRDQPSVGFASKSTMAYSLLIRCSQPSMIFFNYGGTTNLIIDYNNTYQLNEMCFIPIYSNFMTSDNNIYVRYTDSSHQYVKQEISPGNLYSLDDFGNPSILYLGGYA